MATRDKVLIAQIAAVSTVGGGLATGLVGAGKVGAGIAFGCGTMVLSVVIGIIGLRASRPATPPAPPGSTPLRTVLRNAWNQSVRFFSWVRARRARAVLLGVVLLLPLTVPFAFDSLSDHSTACAVPRQVRVLTSQESYAAVTSAVDAFEQQEPGRCYSTHLVVYAAKDEQAAVEAVAAGWPDSALGSIGPRPDVWIPDSPADLPGPGSSPSLPGLVRLGTVGYSPLVVAVPQTAAVPDTLRQGDEWRSLYTSLTQRQLGLALPNPDRSDVGRFQLFRLYQQVTAAADRRQISHRPEFPADSQDLLCTAQQAALSGTGEQDAYLVSEVAVIAENTGDLEGSRCRSEQQLHLIALYPADTLSLQFPFLVLHWNRATGTPAQLAAADFQRWLSGPDGASVLLDHGIRPSVCGPNGSGGVFSSGVDGVLGSDPSCASASPVVPTDAQSTATRNVFDAARAPARILVGVDDSGSMSPYLPGISAALSAALGSPGTSLTARDSFGIWAFPAAHRLYQPLDGIAAADGAHRRALTGRISPLASPHQPSANYDLLTAAAATLSQPAPPGEAGDSAPVPSVVLLTNGDGYPQGDPGGSTEASALQRLHGANPAIPVYVLAYGPGGCTPSLTLVADRSGGTCYAADQGDPRQLLAQIFDRLSGG